MKRISIISLFILSSFLSIIQAQNTLVYNPANNNMQDCVVALSAPNLPLPDFPENKIYCWTQNGIVNYNRIFVEFDLSEIPDESNIMEAYLILHFDPTNNSGIDGHSGDNILVIRRITSPWDDFSVTWNNQPQSTSLNEVYYGASNYKYENAVIDVTTLMQDMVDNPSSSYGFSLQLIDETPYKAWLFASSENSDISRHPHLIVRYGNTPMAADEQPIKNKVTVFPNPTTSKVSLLNDPSIKIKKVRVYYSDGRFLSEYIGENPKIFLLTPGTYLLEIYTDEGVLNEKVIVSN